MTAVSSIPTLLFPPVPPLLSSGEIQADTVQPIPSPAPPPAATDLTTTVIDRFLQAKPRSQEEAEAFNTLAALYPRWDKKKNQTFPDKVTAAALCFLLSPSGSDKQMAALKRLEAIVRAVCRGTNNGHWNTRDLFLTEPTQYERWDKKRGMWIPEPRDQTTLLWIEEELLGEGMLAPYRQLSRPGIEAAAARGEFSDLAIRVRNKLNRAVQQQKRHQQIIVEVPLDPVRDEYETEDASLLSSIGTQRADAPSSWVTAHVSYEERMRCADDILRLAVDHAAEFKRLDLFDGLIAAVRLVRRDKSFDLIELDKFDRAFAREIAAVRGESRAAAEAYKAKFHATMRRELDAGNLLVRALWTERSDLVRRARETHDRFYRLRLFSEEAAANERLRAEALEDNAEFYKWCYEAGIDYKEPMIPAVN